MPAYKDKQGKWYCKFYYTDYTGDKKQKLKRGFSLKKEAMEFEKNFLEEIEKQNSIDNITFEKLYNRYIAYITPRLRLNTLLSKKSKIESNILPYFKDTCLYDIDKDMIVGWQNELLSKSYSPGYQRELCNQLTSIFNYAIENKIMTENPLKRNAIGSSKKLRINYWTHEEYTQFRSYCPSTYVVPFDILYYCGMRVSEMMALTLSDIDFTTNEIHIYKGYHRIHRNDIVDMPKTIKSNRTIVAPKFLLEEIKTYCDHIYGLGNDDRIFQFAKNNLNKILNTSIENNSLKKIVLHDLRDSHATLLIKMGYTPTLVAQRLGHESPKITLERYIGLWDNEQQKVANQLDQLFH